MTPEELTKYLKVNSIKFLKTENMTHVLKINYLYLTLNICLGCFNGKYSSHLIFKFQKILSK